MNELALFAGGGGGLLGGKLLGWRTRCAVEINTYARKILLARQRDGCLPRFPIWDDIITFDGEPWRGFIDVVSGGFPCQDISAANKKAEGITGKRSGLWGEMARIIGEVRPRFVFAENSPLLTIRGLDRVLADLASMGYNVAWGVLGARDIGAPHQRDRIWIVGRLRNPDSDRESAVPINDEASRVSGNSVSDTNGEQLWEQPESITGGNSPAKSSDDGIQKPMAHSDSRGYPGGQDTSQISGARREGQTKGGIKDSGVLCNPLGEQLQGHLPPYQEGWEIQNGSTAQSGRLEGGGWWGDDPAERAVEPRLDRVVNGMAHRVDRIRAIGNGQVPAVAALAVTILSEVLDTSNDHSL